MKDVIKRSDGQGKRKKGKYRIKNSVLAFAALIVFVILSLTLLFNVKSVTVEGNSVYSVEEIIAASTIKSGDNIIRKNLASCERSLTEKLVYIERAEVSRASVSALRIKVYPSIETLNIEKPDGSFYIISGIGKILRESQDYDSNLITVYGAEAGEANAVGTELESDDEKKTETVKLLIDVLDSCLIKDKLRSFDITDRLYITCSYEDRITIELGGIAGADEKLKFAGSIISEKIAPETRGVLKMLERGATFIDEEGLLFNESIFMENISSAVEEDTSGESGTEVTEETDITTSAVVNFE